MPNVDSGTKLLTAKAIIRDKTCQVAFSPWQTPGRSSEQCRAGEGLFAQQRTSTPDKGKEPDETARRERGQRRVISEEDIGLICKLEMRKLGQTLRKAGQELLASTAAGSEGSFQGKVWNSWTKAGKKLLRQASKEITEKSHKKQQLLWPQSSPKDRKEFVW